MTDRAGAHWQAPDELANTTCNIPGDGSMYWAPSMYFHNRTSDKYYLVPVYVSPRLCVLLATCALVRHTAPHNVHTHGCTVFTTRFSLAEILVLAGTASTSHGISARLQGVGSTVHASISRWDARISRKNRRHGIKHCIIRTLCIIYYKAPNNKDTLHVKHQMIRTLCIKSTK